MSRTAYAAGWPAGAAAAIFLGAPAAARPDDVPVPPQPAVRLVEVPVDDRRAEVIQMLAAAALGAGCVAGARRPRRDSRPVPADTAPAVIDLTDTAPRT